MSDRRWEQVKQIVDEALERDISVRQRFVDDVCGDDAALKQEVHSLLGYESSDFLERSPAELAAADSEPDRELPAGQELGPYRVVEKLGAGGMGEVYRARDERLERDVALKLLPANTFSDSSARGRLLREARSAAGLNHPHICTVYDVGEAEGQVYIAMELVEGEPLSTRLAKGPLDPEDTQRYALQLADALAHAHERGIVHRDLKSANIVIGSDGRAKVLDFGLAKRMMGPRAEGASAEYTMTQPGTVMGTLSYMPPEQLKGEAADARSDVWALGVVFHEMASGERPFQGATAFELSAAILNEAPRPILPSATPSLKSVVDRCLDKNPSERFQNGQELHATLEALHSGAQTPLPLPRRRTTTHRRRWLLPTVALALTGVVIVGLGWQRLSDGLLNWDGWESLSGSSAPAIESLVVLPLSNLSGDPAQEFLADGMTESLIAELSKLQGLSVVSRTSAMRYKQSDKSFQDIVGELGVDAVIEGGVLRENELFRVSINLIDGRTDKTLWAQSFERESAGILALHSEMVRAIADEVELTLSPQEEASLAGGRPVNPEAYEAYLKGRMHWYKQTPQEVDRAMQYFQLAEQKDPDFALAHLGMGYVWTYYASVGLLPVGEMSENVLQSVRRARAIDPTLAESWEAEADYEFYYDWDWEAAEKNYKKGIELKPNSAEMRLYYWEYLVAMQRPQEAKTQIERCLELDPFNSYVQTAYGMFLLSTRQFDQAIDQFHDLLQSEMDFGPAQLGLWQAYQHTGRQDLAFAAVREYFSKWGDDEMAVALDEGFTAGGYTEAMRQAALHLEERSVTYHVLATQVATFWAYAGETERTLDWLERSFEERETGLVKIQIDPDWDLVRSEARFQEIVNKMDFPPA